MQENQEVNEIFEKNIELLRKKNLKLVDKILEHTAENIDFAYALNNEIIMLHDGIPLHSLHDPIKEAQDVYNNVKHKDFKSFHLLFGLGLGYLLKRASMEIEGTIVVFEPCLDVLRMTLEVVDFSEELEKDNIFITDDYAYLRYIFFTSYYHGDYVGMQITPSYKAKFPEELRETVERLQDLYRNSTLNQNTFISKSKSWSLAALNNIFDIASYPNVISLREKMENIPAVVVSAGPSLEYALETLKEVQDKVFIVAVGQALKALDKAGIVPDLVVVIENMNVSNQFDDVKCINDLTVVLQPMTHRTVYKLPVNRYMLYFPTSDNIAKWYGREVDKDVKGLPNRGTVSISAFYVALCARCSPIIMVGQDLAYRDGKMYADNSSYSMLKYSLDENGKIDYNMDDEVFETYGKGLELTREELEQRRKTFIRDTIFVKGWNDEDLLTSVSYKVFLDNYIDIAERELADNDDVRVINSSEGGAYIKGFEHLSFKDAIAECDLENGCKPQVILDNLFDEFNKEEKPFPLLVKAIETALNDLKYCSEMAKGSIEIANKIEKEINKKIPKITYVDKLIEKLGKSDKKLIGKIKDLELINPFIQTELFNFSKGYSRQKDSEKEEDKVKNLKANIETSKALYEAIISGTEQVSEILPSVLKDNEDLINGDFAQKAQ